MNYYIQKVRENVFPLSVGNSLPPVFTEWFFTEQVLDYEQRKKPANYVIRKNYVIISK